MQIQALTACAGPYILKTYVPTHNIVGRSYVNVMDSYN